MISPSKVSRLETGQRGASARDIRDLCNLYGLGEEQRRHLTDLAAEGKQHAWWQSFDLSYSTYIGLESEATSIRDFGLGVIPGLFQVRDYAQAVTQAVVSVSHHAPGAAERMVEGRMIRQQRILGAGNPPQIETIMDVAVLHRVVGGKAIMRAQLQHLLAVSELPNVTIRVIPYEAGVLPVPNNKFIVLGFAGLALPEVVYIEALTGELYLEQEEQIETYKAAFQALRNLAASPEASRGIITSALAVLRMLRVALWHRMPTASLRSVSVRPSQGHAPSQQAH